MQDKRITCLLWSKDQAQILEFLGFEHLRYADYCTPSGLQHSFYRLDSRQKKSQSTVRYDFVAIRERNEHAVWVDLAKKLLSHYLELDRQHSLLEQYKEHGAFDLELDQLVEQIQAMMEQQLQWLKEGTKQEKIQAQILQYAYLQRRSSHESVAARLDIPISTYYRQQKKIIERIAERLQHQK